MAKTRWGGNASGNQKTGGSDRVRKAIGGLYVNNGDPEQVKEMFGNANMNVVMSPGTKLVLTDEDGKETAYDRDSMSLRIFTNDRPKGDNSFHFNLVAYVDED